MQFGTSKVEIKHGKISCRLRSFFKGGRSVRAAQKSVHAALPMDFQPQNESQMEDEHDRSTKLEDLNLKDWPLEDSFKPRIHQKLIIVNLQYSRCTGGRPKKPPFSNGRDPVDLPGCKRGKSHGSKKLPAGVINFGLLWNFEV